uniref:Uncharacterized protein n=1 Tax=Arundo donax TaxID=35708 RepID=A0A0A9CWN2_ARUDO
MDLEIVQERKRARLGGLEPSVLPLSRSVTLVIIQRALLDLLDRPHDRGDDIAVAPVELVKALDLDDRRRDRVQREPRVHGDVALLVRDDVEHQPRRVGGAGDGGGHCHGAREHVVRHERDVEVGGVGQARGVLRRRHGGARRGVHRELLGQPQGEAVHALGDAQRGQVPVEQSPDP